MSLDGEPLVLPVSLSEIMKQQNVSLPQTNPGKKAFKKKGVRGKKLDTDHSHDLITYTNFCEARAEWACKQEFTGISEMVFYKVHFPKMRRRLMIIEVVSHGIKVVSVGNGVEMTLDRIPTETSLEWVDTMSHTNAYFNMSKNGNTIRCDMRPTFFGSVAEVQIIKTTPDGKHFIEPLHIVELLFAPGKINEMLCV